MKKLLTKFTIIIVFLTCTSISFETFAQTNYFVSTGGDDGNSGLSISLAKRNINSAVSAASDGDIIDIAAGTYAERVYVNKSLTFRGSNAGQNATGWTNSATIIVPNNTDFSNTAASAIFELVANNITIDGIAFYGDNDALSDAPPKIINSQNVRTNSGIINYQSLSGQKIINSKFKNFASNGITMSTNTTALSAIGNEIKNNLFDNISASTNDASGIFVSNYIADISNNDFTRVDRAVFYNGSGTTVNTGSNLTISNNNISAYFNGILMYFETNSNNPATLMENNTINWSDISLRTGTGITSTSSNSSRGISIENAKGNSLITVKNNTINGLNNGLFANSIEKSSLVTDRFSIEGGTISNSSDVGIVLRNDLGQFASRLIVNGTMILNAATSGLQAYGNSNPVKTEIALRNSVQIQHDNPIPGSYNHAIYLDGLQATITELNDTKITGASNRVITLFNNAMKGLEVDGSNMTFNGLVNGYTFNNFIPAQSNDNAIAIALQERVLDKNQYSFGGPFDSGLIRFNFGSTLPITLLSYQARLQNTGIVELTWKTASEINNKLFIVSHSINGKEFSELKRVVGSGNSTTEKNYVFFDKDPISGINYYKLQQQDYDGNITDLGIKAVTVSIEKDIIISYPNPTENFLNVQFNEGVYNQIELVATDGKILKNILLNKSNTSFIIDLTNNASGIYYLKLIGQKTIVRKVVKK